PLSEYDRSPPPADLEIGIRIGIVARASEDDAWQAAHHRFPVDRKGQVAHQMAMKVSDSVWHQQLSQLGKSQSGSNSPYWMQPFENHQTFCPYLVGTYERVAREVAAYARVGYRTVILDIPRTREELEHIRKVFSLADAHAGREDAIAGTETPAP
ncbi:MAG: alkanesulfonate monooxygenase, partial [Phycisphaerae bacterium]